MKFINRRGEWLILNHAKIKPLRADAETIRADINVGSAMDWRAGLLLVLPFVLTFGWATGSWPVVLEGSTHLNMGNAALQFGFFYLAVFSLYYSLRSIVSTNSSFWAALCMGLNPWFLSSLGAAAGAGIACALGALAAITCAVRSGRVVLLMSIAGALYAASISAHAWGWTYLPILFLAFLFLNHQNSQLSVKRGLIGFAAGGLLGAVYLFESMSPMVLVGDFFQLAGGDPIGPFTQAFAWEQWPAMTHLHLVTVLWLLSAILLFTVKTNDETSGFAAYWMDASTRPYGFCVSLCFIYGLIVMTLEGGLGFNVLALPEMSVFGIPLACVGLAGVLERGGLIDERRHRHGAVLLLVSLTLVTSLSLDTVFTSAIYTWGTLALWGAVMILLWQLPFLKKTAMPLFAGVALILLAGFILTGPNHPGITNDADAESLPQLTRSLEKFYE